jgi:ribose 5-phosphate isomerase B
MKIAVGSDHRGFQVKKAVIKYLSQLGLECYDFSCPEGQPVDYPDIASLVGQAVASRQYDIGILACGTGIGMCIAANKIGGIRAATCYDTFCARRARQHNDANILCLSGDITGEPVEEILAVFIKTPFEGGRHQRRVDKISQLENRYWRQAMLTGQVKAIYKAMPWRNLFSKLSRNP